MLFLKVVVQPFFHKKVCHYHGTQWLGEKVSPKTHFPATAVVPQKKSDGGGSQL
jgi:hypothetical protein